MSQLIIAGIDPGTKTGLAFFDVANLKLVSLYSVMIHEAFELILTVSPVFVRVEDARQRGSFGKMDEKIAKYGYGVREGAGAAKRDATIWDDFLKAKGFRYEMVNPSTVKTKVDANYFKRVTGWTGRTNEHMRDATAYVHNFTRRSLDFYLTQKGGK